MNSVKPFFLDMSINDFYIIAVLNSKPHLADYGQYSNMYRIKSIEEVFYPFPLNKSPFFIVHIQRNKSKASLPFIDQPAASNNCLCRFVLMQPVHDQEKYKAFISVICFEKIGDSKKQQHPNNLHESCMEAFFSKRSTRQNARYPRNKVKKTFCLSGYSRVPFCAKFHGISEIQAKIRRFLSYLKRLWV